VYTRPYERTKFSMYRCTHSCVHTAVSQCITVPLCKSKLFIGGSCPILVLTTVLGRPRHADAKNDVKNYQGPTTSRENAIRKYLNFLIRFFKFCCDYDLNLCRYLNPELPPMRYLASPYFLIRHTFVCATCSTLFRRIKLILL
jgi:hypothetical protein